MHLTINLERCTYLALIGWAVLGLSRPGPCDTLVVDDDGGPGVDFVELKDAVAAANDGDLILVKSGSYDQVLSINKGLRIVGEPGVAVRMTSVIEDLSQGDLLALKELSFARLLIRNSQGSVVLQGVTISDDPTIGPTGGVALLRLDNCDDVRLAQSIVDGSPTQNGRDATRLESTSRLELTDSLLIASKGADGNPLLISDGEDGGTGLLAKGGSRVHASASSILGGAGGDEYSLIGALAGWGGTGADINGTSTLVLTGDGSDFIKGGQEGLSNLGGNGVEGCGVAIAANAKLRHSGATTMGGGVNGISNTQGGTVESPVPDDPYLRSAGGNSPRDQITFRVNAARGSLVTLHLGVTLVVSERGTEIEELLVPARTRFLGVVPEEGFVDATFHPGLFATGFFFAAQAEVVMPNGELRRTNSAPMLIGQ